MKLLLTLSREHPTLPRAELEGVLAGEGIDFEVLREQEGKLLLEVNKKKLKFLQRLALTKKAVEVVGEVGEKNLIKKNFKRIEGKSFRVSAKSKKVERELGTELSTLGCKVDLKNFQVEVVVDGKLVGVNILLERGFESRKAQHRPFFHPTSLHPKLARALVNLARVRAGDTVLDPFCGTGGILIEAGLMDLKVEGVDANERAAEGCRKNLKHYKLVGKVTQGDALKIKGKFKAVVTDAPYGRGSFVDGESAGRLAEEFIEGAEKLMDAGGRLVIVSNRKLRSRGKLQLAGLHELRVHKSLTRIVHVFGR